jgi:uncharacterized SAM-binding protein YcdF (DUF218 family)
MAHQATPNNDTKLMRLGGPLVKAICAALCLYFMAMMFAVPRLMEKDPPTHADIIVVLGGDVAPRAAKAAALWHQGLAPAILVSGAGDCHSVQALLLAASIGPDAIAVECASKDTWENASFSARIMAPRAVRSAILVTSWYHSKRAVDRFRAVMPNVFWMSVPAENPPPFASMAFHIDGIWIAQEWLKVIFYDLRSLSLTASGRWFSKGWGWSDAFEISGYDLQTRGYGVAALRRPDIRLSLPPDASHMDDGVVPPG